MFGEDPRVRRIVLPSALFVAACGGMAVDADPLGTPKTLHVASAAFADGGMIPEKFTADGADVSPPLAWSGAPAATKRYALVVDDPDAPGGTWTHWTVWNLEGTTLDEGVSNAPATVLPPFTQGRNSFGAAGYGGPSPPSGTHRYVFRVYALDGPLDLAPTADADVLRAAMKGHALAYGALVGKYAAKK
jgi:Raf kinase inhibitor-like YbhB/YbcL family protein